jgi:AraC-like DNA-binding protein
MTLSEYFQEAKIAYAKRQLEYTNDSILSIASDLGTSLSRFDNAFKRHEGMTPMQYRHFCKSKNREAELETESEREQSDEE